MPYIVQASITANYAMSTLVDCIDRRDADSAKDLLASHYNLVIKGYKFNMSAPPDIDLKIALGL